MTKKPIFIITVLFASITVNAQKTKSKVKVIKIDSTESYYFIKGVLKSKPKRKVLIISKKDSLFKGCKKIKPRKIYDLELRSYLSEKEKNRLPAKPPGNLILREDGYIIWDGKSDLPYKSPNIKSLYIKD